MPHDFQVHNEVLNESEPRKTCRREVRPEMEKPARRLKGGEASEVFDFPQALVCFRVVGRHRAGLKEVLRKAGNPLRQEKANRLWRIS
jgi:hypothetical protein